MAKSESTARVELSNNPYLRKTEIRFKDKLPKRNSHVTQYLHDPLSSWIRKVPSIFHDEMNGYDFRLDFKGTVLDFEELKKAFQAAGIPECDVRFNHINVLGDRNEKIEQLKAFYQWILEHPNRKLNADEVEQVKAELEKLQSAQYTLVLITGNVRLRMPSTDDDVIRVESVADAETLQGTQLHNIPIVFYLDESTVSRLQENLEKVRSRDDITDEQLFFWVPPLPDKDRIVRVVKDLGILVPQIVEAVDDGIIKRYCDIYPISQNIYESIRFSQKLISIVEERLRIEELQTQISSNDVGVQIGEIEEKLDRCKAPYESFLKKDNYSVPEAFKISQERFIEAIMHWQYGFLIFGTKLTLENDAKKAAQDFEMYLQKHYAEFLEDITEVNEDEESRIMEKFASWYGQSPYSPLSFVPEVSLKPFQPAKALPPLADDIMKLQDREVIDERMCPVWYYQKWREQMAKVLTLFADQILEERKQALDVFYNKLAESYLVRLDCQIGELVAEKKDFTAQLSDEMKRYQSDRDWCEALNIKLAFIERG